MEYILPGSSANASTTACPPPSITFTGKEYNLKLLDLSICREQASGGIPDIKFSDFKIQYSIDNQIVSLPSNLEACLLFLQKGCIWRTAKVEALYKELHTTNTVSSMTDDASLCLVVNGCKQLASSCRDFFCKESDYEFFICLFSKENNALVYYTERQEMGIKTRDVQIPEQELLKLEIMDPAQLVLIKNNGSTAKVAFTSPTVSLSGSGVVNEGFLMAQNTSLLDNYGSKNKKLVSKYITNGGMEPMHEGDCLVFKKETPHINTCIKDIYNTNPNATWICCDNQLAIIYWAQCTDGSIVLSKPSVLSCKEVSSSMKDGGTQKTKATASDSPDSKSSPKRNRPRWLSSIF